ncbi:hypothetical protein CERZMDRAFT_99738 [Cercospora zeae-maydis SCOH1-5]|uniref:DUF937 domain-containing protein n=1 Tax=Cercospora zeae-maydis SCOH1-5 TaxID=717836 RepID=A0A6A6F9F9_9PEZI|nr:hypothetical protein CERZMDRAFT_99738 [Cercospora zeae-maydis SCOH1-5]
MKFSAVVVPALMGLAHAQDVVLEDKREAEPGVLGALNLAATVATFAPVIQSIWKKFGKRDLSAADMDELNSLLARDLQLDADDIKILSSLQTRDAEAEPGVLGALGLAAAAAPLIQSIFKKFGKRDLSAADMDELNSLLARDAEADPGVLGALGLAAAAAPLIQSIFKKFGKRDLSDADYDELNSLLARDAEADPISAGALAMLGGLVGPLANWAFNKIGGKPAKRDLTAAEVDELSSLFARDAEAALGPGAIALLGSAAYPVANWFINKITSKRDLSSADIDEFSSLFARDAEADPISAGALAMLGGLVGPLANWAFNKIGGKPAKRDLTAAEVDELSSLFARDAEAALGPGAIALLGSAAYPVANWFINKITSKRDLSSADIDEFSSLFARDAAVEKRDLSASDIEAINSLFERDVSLQAREALSPAGWTVASGVFGAAVNWAINKLSPVTKRDFTDDDIAELHSILTRDLTLEQREALTPAGWAVASGVFGAAVNWAINKLSPATKRDLTADDIAELHSILTRDLTLQQREALGPAGWAVASGAFGAAVNWVINKLSPPKSRRSIAEFAPVVRRDNLVFTPVQFRA